MSGTVSIAVYSDKAPPDAVDGALAIADAVGLTVESQQLTEDTAREQEYGKFAASHANSSVRFQFNLSDDRPPGEPVLTLGGLSDTVHPKWARSNTNYQEWMDIVFELVCRLAKRLEADYVAWLNTAKDPMKSVPEDRPIGEAVEQPPILGVYATPVLEDLGGVSSLFDTEPWYVADIDSDRTIVIKSAQPWVEGDWRPPADDLVDSVIFRDDSEQTVSLSDPFAVLSPGDYGADACVAREDIAAEFPNEDLRMIRVYVDDDRNLRRVADDTFVRNVVTQAGDDEQAIIEGMLADIPPDADDEEVGISALLHGAVPPSFVRLDAPDGENVVSRVLELDIETNKVGLLVSLGEAARHGEGLDTQTIESALDNLADLEDSEVVDAYIRENLL